MNGKVWRAMAGISCVLAIGLTGWAASRGLLADGQLEALRSPLAPQDIQRTLSEPYRFVALGDWGAGTPFQKDVAKQMVQAYQEQPFDAVLMLGDNIYPDGDVKKHGQAYFTNMYQALIRENVQFIVAIGNHDVVRGYQADQLRFFNLPGYYYSVKKPGVEFFVIDSNKFANDQVQRQWLSQSLAASDADWKVVIGHHPIYSSGEHGMNRGLKMMLEPLLVKHHADLYLAGHDHDYERFKPIEGVRHVVSGGGGAYLRNFETPLPASLIRIKAHHFLSFELKGNRLKMKVIDKTGKLIDQVEWKNDAKPAVRQEQKQAS